MMHMPRGGVGWGGGLGQIVPAKFEVDNEKFSFSGGRLEGVAKPSIPNHK